MAGERLMRSGSETRHLLLARDAAALAAKRA
jgi:hypothetical protein